MSGSGLRPFLAHASGAPVAWRNGQVISREAFCSDVAKLIGRLTKARWALISASDRYAFAVGLAAACASGQTCLMPSNYTAHTVADLAMRYPGLYCLCGSEDETFGLPRVPILNSPSCDNPLAPVPTVASDHVAAMVFTSGSTGAPTAHPKRFADLVQDARAEGERLGWLTAAPGAWSVLGTVPPQHMYGIESTVLMPLHTGMVMHAGKPLFPADIASALKEMPGQRLLVTTPFHLRTLLNADVPLPPIHAVMSATAPLSPQLAAQCEVHTGAPLVEIYGCTESGQLASRRTTQSPRWTCLQGVWLDQTGETTFAQGGHVDGRVALSDVIELHSPTEFTLHGRSADMINLAGKRTSLGFLNHHLNAIPGVVDAAFVAPQEQAVDGVTRLLALAVLAPGVSREQVQAALRERVDAAFLPRRLIVVDALPRNATGKLTFADVQALLDKAA